MEDKRKQKGMQSTISRLMIKKKKIVLLILLLVLNCLYLFALYLRLPINSDFASHVLEANDMISGNWLLDGWNLTGISFLLTELPVYILSAAIFGVSTETYVLSTGIAASCLLCAAFLLCADSMEEYNLVDFLVLAAVAGTPCIYEQGFLRGHTMMFAYSFIVFYLVRRFLSIKKPALLLLIPFSILLLAGCGSDLLMIPVCLVPVVLLLFIDILRNSPFWEVKRSLILIVVGAVSAIVGILLERVFFFFSTANANSFFGDKKFIPLNEIPGKLDFLLSATLKMFGCYYPDTKLVPFDVLVTLVRMIIPAVFLWLVFRALIIYIKGQEIDSISLMLSFSVLIMSLICLTTDFFSSQDCERYIAYFPFAAAVLIVRYLHSSNLLETKIVQRRLPVYILLTILCLVSVIPTIQIPRFERAVTSNERLAQFLEENDLKYGLAHFWIASNTTVSSENQVQIRAVTVSSDADHIPTCINMQNWFCKTEWYDESFNFFVFDSWWYRDVGPKYIVGLYGEPEEILSFEGYTIYIYEQNLGDKLVIPEGVSPVT